MGEFLHVQEIEIRNFKAVKEAKLSLMGAHCYVVGPNGQGKTSFLDFIFMMLSKRLAKGLTTPIATKMINQDADAMSGTITLGNDGETKYTVKIYMSRKGGTLDIKVLNEDGQRITPTRKVLDELVGVVDFDINAFLKLEPKMKVQIMKEWTGIDFSDFEEQLKYAQEERKASDRKLERLQQELTSLGPVEMNHPHNFEEISIDTITQKRDTILQRQDAYDDFLERYNDIPNAIDNDEWLIRNGDEEIAKLEEKIAEIRKSQEVCRRDIEQARRNQEVGKAYLEKHPRPTLEEVDNEYRTMAEHNEQVKRNRRAAELMEQIHEEQKVWSQKNADMFHMEKVLKDEIKAAKLPVPGLTFDENGLYLNGLPFESSQINTAELVIAAIQLQLPLMRKVGIARFDASLLDKKNRKRVEDWANAHGIQLFEEEVDRNTDEEGIHFVLKERENTPSMAIAV